jgi:elongation factor P--(R)-beta-lysine ligase
MTWWMPHRFEEKRHFLEMRGHIIKDLRRFFEDQGFVEVQTPVLQVCPTMDAHIHGFQTVYKGADLASRKDLYLQTSPEFDMKKLLVAGMPKIYQICPAFRNAERSRLHSPEFTILEWYRTGADYTALMQDCVDIMGILAEKAGIRSYQHGGRSCDPFRDWQRISVTQAFLEYAGIDLSGCLEDRERFANQAIEQGVRIVSTDQWDDIFHAVMAAKIEPFLGMQSPCILYDYPVCLAALSRPKPSDPRYAERFEVYVCGVELANGFSELTDAAEQRTRYAAEMAAKQTLYGETYPVDEDFLAALEYGMPECAGIALGLDRLVMLATGADHIEQILWAPVQI